MSIEHYEESDCFKAIIELDSFGLNLSVKTIAVAEIINDRTGDEKVGNYKYLLRCHGRTVKKGRIEGHRRTQEVWRLVYKILCDTYGGKDDKLRQA